MMVGTDALEPMMATRIKPPPKELMKRYVWSQRQAELLRARSSRIWISST